MLHILPQASVTLAEARTTLRHPGATEDQVLVACNTLDLRGEALDRVAAHGTRKRIERERVARLFLRIAAGAAVLAVLVMIAGRGL